MQIPYIKIATPKISSINKYFKRSVQVGQYTNFGPNEQELTKLLNEKINADIVCTANATLILDGLHHILSQKVGQAFLPTFTFPATNLGCRLPFAYGKTSLKGDTLGFAEFEGSWNSYAITTAPFGAAMPQSYKRPMTDFWIVDNAAGASPEMINTKNWLDAGADVVIVSLHSTKILTGCEGGFAAFKNKQLYLEYRKYINFGLYLNNGEKCFGEIGSNHKMSEITAAYVLAYYSDIFDQEYRDRIQLADSYADMCEKHGIKYIYSPQAFYLVCRQPSEKIKYALSKVGVEALPYYKPLCKNAQQDENAKHLSDHGLVLPTWAMSSTQQKYCLKKIAELL